jgi:adenosine kinase
MRLQAHILSLVCMLCLFSYAELVKDFPVEYIAGGATQNSIRTAQWALQTPNATVYTGCVGADSFGAELARSASADGVKVLYQINAETPTGTCACLIKDHERSLVANLAAANKFTPEHLETPALKEAIEKARIYYSSGFFLTVSPPAFQAVAAHANKADKIVALNLAAPFIPSFFSEPLLAAIKVSDFVFGNESEAEAFATQQKLEKTDAETVAKYIAALPQRDGASRPRTAIITQGAQSTVVCVNGVCTKYDVPVLDAKLIVDVNGAGDAFVGGFLAQLARGKDMESCVQAGHYCSRVILQVSGAKLPTTAPDATKIVA